MSTLSVQSNRTTRRKKTARKWELGTPAHRVSSSTPMPCRHPMATPCLPVQALLPLAPPVGNANKGGADAEWLGPEAVFARAGIFSGHRDSALSRKRQTWRPKGTEHSAKDPQSLPGESKGLESSSARPSHPTSDFTRDRSNVGSQAASRGSQHPGNGMSLLFFLSFSICWIVGVPGLLEMCKEHIPV